MLAVYVKPVRVNKRPIAKRIMLLSSVVRENLVKPTSTSQL